MAGTPIIETPHFAFRIDNAEGVRQQTLVESGGETFPNGEIHGSNLGIPELSFSEMLNRLFGEGIENPISMPAVGIGGVDWTSFDENLFKLFVGQD